MPKIFKLVAKNAWPFLTGASETRRYKLENRICCSLDLCLEKLVLELFCYLGYLRGVEVNIVLLCALFNFFSFVCDSRPVEILLRQWC